MSIRPTNGSGNGYPSINPSNDNQYGLVQSTSGPNYGGHTVSSRGGFQGICVRIADLFRNCFSRNRGTTTTPSRTVITQADIYHPTISGQGAQPIVSTGDKKLDSVIIQADLRAQNKQTLATHIQSKLGSMEGQSPQDYKAGAYSALRLMLFTPGETTVSSERERQACVTGRDLWEQAAGDLATNGNTDGLMLMANLSVGGKHVPAGHLREYMDTVKGTFTDENEATDPTVDAILDLAAKIDATEFSSPGSGQVILNYIGNYGQVVLENEEMNLLVLEDQNGQDPQRVQDNSKELQKLLENARKTDPELYFQTLTVITSSVFLD